MYPQQLSYPRNVDVKIYILKPFERDGLPQKFKIHSVLLPGASTPAVCKTEPLAPPTQI